MVNEKALRSRSGWAELLRPPNLLTVPGDPIAGYLLASSEKTIDSGALVGAVAASLLFYAAGLISNDWLDRKEDARERPQRPIPSGRVAAAEALVVWVLLMGMALLICFLMGLWTWQVGAALAALILVYNLRFKQIRYLGPLTMGFCRGFNLLLGAAAAGGPNWYMPAVMLAFDVETAYVAAIAHLAREETTPHRIGMARWAPAFVLAAGFALFAHFAPSSEPAILLIFVGGFSFSAVVALLAGDVFERAAPDEAPRAMIFLDSALRQWLVPRLIGLLLSTLVMLQAAWVAAAGAGDESLVFGAALLSLWPVHRMMAERYCES